MRSKKRISFVNTVIERWSNIKSQSGFKFMLISSSPTKMHCNQYTRHQLLSYKVLIT